MTLAGDAVREARLRTNAPELSPTQQAAFDDAIKVLAGSAIVTVSAKEGMGVTTVLRALHAKTGGTFLTIRDFEAPLTDADPMAYEQTVNSVIDAAYKDSAILYFEDSTPFEWAGNTPFNDRKGLFNLIFRALADRVEAQGRKLVLSRTKGGFTPSPGETMTYRASPVVISDLKQTDYEHILGSCFGADNVSDIDFDKVYRFSRKLSAYYLNTVGSLVKSKGIVRPSTRDVTDVIAEQLLRSNVNVKEVEHIKLEELVGIDHIIEKLERTVLLPMQQPELAAELGLESKHGVLLHGAPGTGKTTIGRALAHTMKGKFFMIDGDFNHESGGSFINKVNGIFSHAARNSPSVIFIDDADVILSAPHMQYFARYLLTQLDGIQSESLGRVCVMMTAMNISDMPMALLRSGRLEVWLETKLPAEAHRQSMIESYVDRLPISTPAFDSKILAKNTEGFTPADLRRMVGDAAGHLAFDRHTKAPTKSLEAYLDISARDLRQQKMLADIATGRRSRHS